MMQFTNLEKVAETENSFKKRTGLKMTVIFITVLVFLQCKSGTEKNGAGELAEIDIAMDYPGKELYLQDITKVEYIPFETNDNALMSRSAKIFYVSDDYIIAANIVKGDVLVFDGNGKWKKSFNHKGQGAT